MKLEARIEEIAGLHDVDLVGFARTADIQLAVPPRPAEDLLPGARSVVVFAAALLRGALNCPRGTKGAVKDAQLAYDRMERAGAAVGRFLESKGYVAYLPPASMPVDVVRRGWRSYCAAEWSHRQAAIAAGLGVKGYNNLLITPEYGPYVRLASLLTTAELEPSARDLPDDVCSGCMACVTACPVGALDPHRTPLLDTRRCRSYYMRPITNPSKLDTARKLLGEQYWLTAVQALLEGYYFSCAECQRVWCCLV